MLDLSAAFDCVDHTILLQRLRIGFGKSDVALQWITSFMTERTQQIAYIRKLSSIQAVLFGVPQGSVLWPLLYVYVLIHCRVVPYRRLLQTVATHVRRRLPSLPQHASQGHGNRSRPPVHLRYRNQRLDDGKPTAIKPNHVLIYMAAWV